MSRVAVVGDIITDIVAIHNGPLAIDSDTPARIRLGGGGSGANTAAWLAYLGRPVDLIGVVGSDRAGADRLAELTEAGVNCAAVRRTDEAPTGSVIVLTHGQDRTMVTDRGANLHLRRSDVDLGPDVAHLHLSGYTLLDPQSRPAGRYALETAAARGLTTSVDAASAAPLARVGGFADWIAGVDLVLANLDEARVLTDSTMDESRTSDRKRFEGLDAAGAARALAAWAGHAVVKHGPAGAVWAAGSDVVAEPAADATLVDSTGAGDAFAAAALDAWLSGRSPEDCLRAAVHLAAQAVGLVGGRPPMKGSAPS